VGFQAVEAIKRARGEDGEFGSLWDFCERVDCRTVNKKAIEALVKCGAFGSTGASRKGMLAVLEQAQAAGQKAQQDALIGQGSIFDLAEAGAQTPAAQQGAGARPGVARPAHPAISAEEFDQPELLAIEKEAIGLFISAHPLKPLRAALRARVDCPLAAIPERQDKEWVTVGGIVTETKRVRTRNGDHMMFATLDDLEGSIEMLVFGKALSEHEAELAVDQVLLVRGRVDHKEAGKSCLVVQDVERFAPSEQELERARRAPVNGDVPADGTAGGPPSPLHLRLDASRLGSEAIDDIKQVIEDYPGPDEVVLELATSSGSRMLRLGEAYRVQHTPSLRAELERVVAQLAGPAPQAAGAAG
jgi:DNA polymerase-3 subunit alpha